MKYEFLYSKVDITPNEEEVKLFEDENKEEVISSKKLLLIFSEKEYKSENMLKVIDFISEYTDSEIVCWKYSTEKEYQDEIWDEYNTIYSPKFAKVSPDQVLTFGKMCALPFYTAKIDETNQDWFLNITFTKSNKSLDNSNKKFELGYAPSLEKGYALGQRFLAFIKEFVDK